VMPHQKAAITTTRIVAFAFMPLRLKPQVLSYSDHLNF